MPDDPVDDISAELWVTSAQVSAPLIEPIAPIDPEVLKQTQQRLRLDMAARDTDRGKRGVNR